MGVSTQQYLEYMKTHTSFLFSIKIELLENDESAFAEISADLLSGSKGNIVKKNGRRRSINLLLANVKGDYSLNPNGNIWIDRKIKLYLGIKIGEEYKYFDWGVYVLSDENRTIDKENNLAEITALDKFALLDGGIKGVLDSTYYVEEGTNINDAIFKLLRLEEINDPAPIIRDKTEEVAPYQFSKETGKNYSDVIMEMTRMLTRDSFYDKHGQFNFLDKVNKDKKPIAFDLDEYHPMYEGLTARANIEEIANVIIVEGATRNGKTYRAVVVNEDLSSPTCIQRIGYHTRRIEDPAITSDYLAKLRGEYELQLANELVTECVITCVPLFHLDVDDVISLTNPDLGFDHERFIITEINMPFDADGRMTIIAVREIQLKSSVKTTAPIFEASVPVSGAINVATSTNLMLTLSQKVYGGEGYVRLFRTSDDVEIQSWQGKDCNIDGKNILLTISSDLGFLTGYYLKVDDNAFYNIYNTFYGGIEDNTTWAFTTEKVIEISQFNPTDGTEHVASSFSPQLTFNQNVYKGEGKFKAYKEDGEEWVLDREWTSSDYIISDNVVTLTNSTPFDKSKKYSIVCDNNAIKNVNNTYFAGIDSFEDWNFKIELELLVSSFDPLDNETNIGIDKSPQLIFNQNVIGGSGKVRIYKADDDTLFEEFVANTLDIVNNIVVINPTNNFIVNATYYILIDGTAFYNVNNQYFEGISDKTVWSFTTTAVYTGNMRTFFATPSMSGSARLKMRPDVDATDVEVRRKDDVINKFQSISVSSLDSENRNVFIHPDGTRIYFVGNTGDRIYEMHMSIPYDITSATYTSGNSFLYSAQENNNRSIYFKSDGTKMYIGGEDEKVYQYTLTTAWQVNTASYQKSYSVPDTGYIQSVHFSPDGTKMVLGNHANGTTVLYNLSTAWEVDTSSYVSTSTTNESAHSYGTTVSSDGKIVWTGNIDASVIYQYRLTDAWVFPSILPYTGISITGVANQFTGYFLSQTEGTEDIIYVSNPFNDSIDSFNTAKGFWNEDDDRTTGLKVADIHSYETETSYSEDDWVIYSGECYISLQDSNLGNTPDSSPTYWINASDINNNEWYTVTGLTDGVQYYFKAFPSKNGAYNETNYLPSSVVHGYYMEDNPYDSIGTQNGTTGSDVTYTDGEVGRCAVFDGTDRSYINCGAPSDFGRAVKTSGNGCAYECWVYTNSWGTDADSNRNDVLTDTVGWAIRIASENTGDLRVTKIKTNLTAEHVIQSGLSLNTWYHVVANIYSDYTMELFINGSSSGINSNTEIPLDATSNKLAIGSSSALSNNWNGNIDEVRFYSESLTINQISNLYNEFNNIHPNETTVIAGGLYNEFSMDDISGSTVINTADGANLSASNVTYSSGKIGNSSYFNGSSSKMLNTIFTGSQIDSSHTIELWVNRSNTGSIAHFNDYRIAGIRNGGQNFRLRDTGGTDHSLNGTISAGVWHHVVYVRSRTSGMTMYIDGEVADTDSFTGLVMAVGNSCSIGYDRVANTDYFQGKIDQFRFYIRALNHYEIVNLYNNGLGC